MVLYTILGFAEDGHILTKEARDGEAHAVLVIEQALSVTCLTTIRAIYSPNSRSLSTAKERNNHICGCSSLLTPVQSSKTAIRWPGSTDRQEASTGLLAAFSHLMCYLSAASCLEQAFHTQSRRYGAVFLSTILLTLRHKPINTLFCPEESQG